MLQLTDPEKLALNIAFKSQHGRRQFSNSIVEKGPLLVRTWSEKAIVSCIRCEDADNVVGFDLKTFINRLRVMSDSEFSELIKFIGKIVHEGDNKINLEYLKNIIYTLTPEQKEELRRLL